METSTLKIAVQILVTVVRVSVVETNFDDGSYDAVFKSFYVQIVKKQAINLVTASGEMASDHYELQAIECT